MAPREPWYRGKNQDALFYLLIAVFFIELIVGGVAFFYGIIHAVPETPGGPPIARFPWLAWGVAAVLSPVALLFVVHLAGSWLAHTLTREEGQVESANTELPEGMRRFYASVRHAPTLVLLLGVLLTGVALFFVEGALAAILEIGKALVPYIPWLAGSLATLLAVCFIAHAVMVYKQRKMENEFAWRREVLEKTGMVLMDKASMPLPGSGPVSLPAASPKALEDGNILDVDAGNQDGESENHEKTQ